MKTTRAAALLGILALGGCSSLADTLTPSGSEGYLGRKGPNIVGGTRLDVDHFTEPDCKTVAMAFFILDLPFSFVLDVVLLPYTITYALLHPGRGSSEGR